MSFCHVYAPCPCCPCRSPRRLLSVSADLYRHKTEHVGHDRFLWEHNHESCKPLYYCGLCSETGAWQPPCLLFVRCLYVVMSRLATASLSACDEGTGPTSPGLYDSTWHGLNRRKHKLQYMSDYACMCVCFHSVEMSFQVTRMTGPTWQAHLTCPKITHALDVAYEQPVARTLHARTHTHAHILLRSICLRLSELLAPANLECPRARCALR